MFYEKPGFNSLLFVEFIRLYPLRLDILLDVVVGALSLEQNCFFFSPVKFDFADGVFLQESPAFSFGFIKRYGFH